MSGLGGGGGRDDGSASAAAHPSQRLLERVAFEPLTAADEAATQAHVAGCGACSGAIAEMRAAAARFVAARPPAVFARTVEGRARAAGRRRAVGGGFALVGVAAAVLIVTGPHLRRADVQTPGAVKRPVGSTRTKGAGPIDLRLFVSRHGEDAQPFDPAAPLHPGDVLRFAATVPDDGYVVVLDLDAAGRISRYHPAQPGGSKRGGPIRRGQAFLPESIHLDDFVGDELIVLAFSPEALDVGRTTTALGDAFRAAGGALDRVSGLDLDGASVALVRIHKEPR
jgi:hypothetical protein